MPVNEAGVLKVAAPEPAEPVLAEPAPPSALPVVNEPEKLLIEALGMLDEPEIVAPLAPPDEVPPAMATEHKSEAASALTTWAERNVRVLLLGFILVFILCLVLLTMLWLILGAK